MEQRITEALPLHRVEAFIKGVVRRLEDGELKESVFRRLALDAFSDPRPQVPMIMASLLPIPKELPEGESDRTARRLIEEFPALYAVTAPLRGRKVSSLEEQERKRLEALQDNLFMEQASVVRRIATSLPHWWLALSHTLPEVRKEAIERIPAQGCPLAIVFPLMCEDISKIVRDAARYKLGMKAKRGWVKHAKDMLLTLEGSRQAILACEGDETKLRRFLVDHRPSVRFLAASQLKPGSRYWSTLATDVSPRLRALTAERAEPDSEAYKKTRGDAHARVREAAERRHRRALEPGKRRYWWTDDEETSDALG